MSRVDKIGTKTHRRNPTSIDRTTVFTDGYKNLITPSTSPSIADVITASGTITLSNVYTVGRDNLTVIVDGIVLMEPGVDFTEDNTQEITLAAGWVSSLNPTKSKIKIIWNRPLPGARDQLLSNLQNVTPDVEDAILDTGGVRTDPIDAANPLIAYNDLNDPKSVFSAHKNGVDQSVAPGSPVKVTFSTEKFDVLSEFSTVNSRFQPTVAGKYSLTAAVAMNSLTAPGTQMLISIRRNTSAEIWMGPNEVTSAGFTDPLRSMTVVVEANGTTDFFEVFVEHDDGGGAKDVEGDATHTYFMGHRIWPG